MGKLHVHEFMSFDGVVEDPRWTFEYGWEPGMTERLKDTMGCQGILLGRKTYEMFEPAWSTRTVNDDPGAPFFNDTMKYVVSSTLTTPTWRNSEIVGGYDAARIRRLKDDVGDIYVSGSISLVQALMADGLVDNLHLFVYPVALGSGLRLFPDGGPQRKLSLAGCEPFANGVVYMNYQPKV